MNFATTRVIHSRSSSGLKPWVCPLPELNGRKLASPKLAPDGRCVELGYGGSAVSPGLVPVFAAHDGVITYAAKTDATNVICLDHPGGWSTQYANLKHMFAVPTDRFRRRRKERVRGGDVLGYVAGPQPLLRFTLAKLFDDDEPCSPIDPREQMRRWEIISWGADQHAAAQHINLPIAA